MPIRNRDDLSLVYTPGVARICLAIADDPSDARRLTIKRNTVAVVTDGSAVLGLGNLGPLAALPVMEGKAALFKRFAGIDAFPICLDTQDTDEIVAAVKAIAPVFAGINLEDISAPRCFEIEQRLRAELDIPVFHDDQHGTAIVTLAALTNALRVVRKALPDVRIVMSGAGAAGTAILTLLLHAGARDVVVCDVDGVVAGDRPDVAGRARLGAGRRRRQHEPARRSAAPCARRWSAPTCSSASPPPASSPATTSPPWRRTRSSSRWPTPTPRSTRSRPPSTRPWWPPAAATSPTRSTTCWRSPGSSAACWTPSPRRSPRPCCWPPRPRWPAWSRDDELNATYIVPSVFHPDVTKVVAAAVHQAAGPAPAPHPHATPPRCPAADAGPSFGRT